jgi:uncharacterized protein with von Willebrand factor type A (vWA) domain
MQTYSFIELLLARDPRRLAQFPDAPLDKAFAEWSALQSRYGALVAKVDEAEKMKQDAPAPATLATPDSQQLEMAGAIASLATNVWRAKAKMVDASTGEPSDEMRRPYRHVAGAMESIEQLGVTINDYFGQPYDPGLPVKVITFQPTPDITRDTVLEVIRPSVIWKGVLIQMGEVVVGVPETPIPPQS